MYPLCTCWYSEPEAPIVIWSGHQAYLPVTAFMNSLAIDSSVLRCYCGHKLSAHRKNFCGRFVWFTFIIHEVPSCSVPAVYQWLRFWIACQTLAGRSSNGIYEVISGAWLLELQSMLFDTEYKNTRVLQQGTRHNQKVNWSCVFSSTEPGSTYVRRATMAPEFDMFWR